jgi:hypothetical protein
LAEIPTARRQIHPQPAAQNVIMLLLLATEEHDMGKYVVAWVLGVPAVLLVGIYLLSHL